MGSDVTALLPAVLLSIMIVLTLILLPHIDKEVPRRSEEPRDLARREQPESTETSTQSRDQQHSS